MRRKINLVKTKVSLVAGAREQDIKLAHMIKKNLAGNRAIENGRIEIEVIDNVVFINGSANTIAEKIFIEEEIKTLPGVNGVINNIEVYHSTPIDDVGIAGNILQCLSLYLRLDLSSLFVKVCNGIVFLRGTVPTLHCKMVAGTLAGKIPQVVGVVNELQVIPVRNR